MLPRGFNKNVRRILQTLAFPMYIVVINGKYNCTCLDVNKQADPACKKCLGTGKRIEIRKVKGAMEPDDLAVRMNGANDKVASNMYYFDASEVSQNVINSSNLVVRDNEVDVLQAPRLYRSDSNDPVYYYVKGNVKKSNLSLFLKNFYDIVRGVAT